MRRLIVSTLGTVLMLAAAGGAAGKVPPTGIEIYGQSGCKTILAGDAERIFISLSGSDSEPAAPAPFFILRWRWSNGPEVKFWWVPKGGLVRSINGRWASQSIASEALLRGAAAGIRPFAAPTVTRAVVGRRLAENPQSYLRLLGGGELASSFDGARGWIDVRLASLEPSPWTNGSGWLRVSKAGSLVWRDVWLYRIAQPLAERARQGLSLTPFVRGT